MIRKNNKYDKYNILNNKLNKQMTEEKKFDLKKFNEEIEDEIKKKRELRLEKEKKELEDLQNKDQEINNNQIKYATDTSDDKLTLLYYFNNWLFSIPRLLGYILTFNYNEITNNDNNFLLYIGIWFIFIGIFFYIILDNYQNESK